jgi:hypothetical protein
MRVRDCFCPACPNLPPLTTLHHGLPQLPLRAPHHAAYIYSIISIAVARAQAEYESHGLFFETSALLITFICLGQRLGRGDAALAVATTASMRPWVIWEAGAAG